jgi:hypothetical protein
MIASIKSRTRARYCPRNPPKRLQGSKASGLDPPSESYCRISQAKLDLHFA